MRSLLVMSGKGGVGKTTIAVNLACALSKREKRVGLLDVDIHGPNAPKMLGLKHKFVAKNKKIIPAEKKGIKVASMAFLLDEEAVIWRGPMKHKMIQQFIQDVEWGDLDYLVVDFPPGTGDEAISIAQLIKEKDSIIVSTPQEVAIMDMKRAIDFSNKLNIPILGLIENMSGDIFGQGGVEKIAAQENLRFLGSIPLDKKVISTGDSGEPYLYKKKVFQRIIDAI